MSDLLPIFPLQQVVLFPRVRCPLHIFETRYRQLTLDALASDERIGMVTLRPEHAASLAGDPPLFDVGCEGRIVQSEKLPDGRYNIVLLGARRFRILDEPGRPEARLYRSARVEYLDDPLVGNETERLGALLERCLDLLAELLEEQVPGARQQLQERLFCGEDRAAVVNTVCQLIDLSPPEKQGLLEADGVLGRSQALVDLLEFRHAERSGGAPAPPRSVH